jgi:hypothetical protein
MLIDLRELNWELRREDWEKLFYTIEAVGGGWWG